MKSQAPIPRAYGRRPLLGSFVIVITALLLAGALFWASRDLRVPAFPYDARSGFLLSTDDVNAGILFPAEVSPETVSDLRYVEDRPGVQRILRELLDSSLRTQVPIYLGLCPRYAQSVSDAGGERAVIASLEDSPEVTALLREGASQGAFSGYNHDLYHCFRWDRDRDRVSEEVAWFNPEQDRRVTVEDLVLSGEITERVTGIPMIAFRSPGYRPYLSESGYSGRPEEKTSRLLAPLGYAIDLNPHSLRYGKVFPKGDRGLKRSRFLWADRLGVYWGRRGIQRHWGPFPFERDDQGVLRIWTYPDVEVIPGAEQRLKACCRDRSFCQESVPFTWMSRPEYLAVAKRLQSVASELGVNMANGLWCPRSFEEILGWYEGVREGHHEIWESRFPGRIEIRIVCERPCPVFTVCVKAPRRTEAPPQAEAVSGGPLLRVETKRGWIALTGPVDCESLWRIRW